MRRLFRQLDQLRPELAAAAQGVLDQWEQDEEGWDEEFGAGGACDAVAAAMQGALARAGVDTVEGGHDGDDHAFLIAYSESEAYGVDVPPDVYEIGGGYVWRKRPGVTVSEDDVEIWEVRRSDLDVDFTRNARRAQGDELVITRFLGICPVCEGRFKLDHRGTATAMSSGFRMVHHGYKRPGDGEIHGDCFGVHYPPYEVSTDGTEQYLGMIELRLSTAREAMQRYESGEVTELRRLENPYSRHEPPRFKLLTPADGWEWRQELQDRMRRLEYEIKGLVREQTRLRALIDGWQRLPVMTLDEDMAQKRAKSDASRAARDAARAVREAKRSAIDQKNAEREAERRELIREYAELFLQLAEQPAANRRAAAGHWAQMHKRKAKKAYLKFWPEKLGVDEALEALGLARPSRHRQGKYDYATDYGLLLG